MVSDILNIYVVIDKLFNYKYDKLPYRSLYFEYKTIDMDSPIKMEL